MSLSKKKSVKFSADDQRENSGRANIEPHKWKPGQSGNPKGRPKAVTQILLDQEIGNKPCPAKIWKEIERQVPGCFSKDWRPPTWLQCEVVKNRIKAMSLTKAGVATGVASLLLMFAIMVHFRDLYEKRPNTELNT